MKIAYLDCFAGISGDMFLGALIGAGVPLKVLSGAAEAMGLGASLRVETVDRSGISAVKVHVMEGGGLAEQVGREPVSRQVQTQHLHKTGHPHTHSQEELHGHVGHVHGRSLTVIKGLISGSGLAGEVKGLATAMFEALGASEAKIHNVPVDEIHFHEVGAVDAIVDLVAAAAGIVHLGVGAWYSSAVNVGGGMVECAHGTFPVPAPATADLLRGVPTYSAHVMKELVTPTGAAILRALKPTYGAQPAMAVEEIGYGAGTRNPEGFPNVLRLSVGSTADGKGGQTVAVIETAVDDATAQVLGYAAEKVLGEGALDVMLTPVVMKKGRPGTLVTVLAKPEDAERLGAMLLRELPTLGVRTRTETRTTLERRFVSVGTEFGEIKVKVGELGGEVLHATPEFEDCKKAAEVHGVALKTVQAAAVAAYGAVTSGSGR